MSLHVSSSQIIHTHSLLICVIYFPPKNLCCESFSFLEAYSMAEIMKKNISKDNGYQIYFTEIGSWICNLLVNQQNGCHLAQ